MSEYETGEWFPAVPIDPLLFWAKKNPGIGLADTGKGIIIEVETENSTYCIVVMNAQEARIVIQGNNKHLPHPTIAQLNGSTFGGSLLKKGRIIPLMHMEIGDLPEGRIVTTSPVQKVERVFDPDKMIQLAGRARRLSSPDEICPCCS